MEAAEEYPDVDVFVRQGILYIAGIPEDEFMEKSLSPSYFLPKAEFSTTYELREPPELIRKKGWRKRRQWPGRRNEKRDSQKGTPRNSIES